MKSAELFHYLTMEWNFRKQPQGLSAIRRIVQRKLRHERNQRLKALDEQLTRHKNVLEQKRKLQEMAAAEKVDGVGLEP